MCSEYVEISPCPLCSQRHRYRLEVERSYVIRMATGAPEKQSWSKPITRFFTCPVENEEFEATFRLLEGSSKDITAVRVTGVAVERE